MKHPPCHGAALALVLVGSAWAGSLLAQGGPTLIREGSVTAVAWPREAGLARSLARSAAEPVDWAGLGVWQPGRVTLIVARDQAAIDSITGGRAPSWGVGFADPELRTVLLRADAPDLRRTLRHELAHLALHDRVHVRVPLWFDEGFAGWAAGEWERLGGLELNLAVARGAVPGLGALDGALRRSQASVGPGYALAISAVLELARRHPDNSLAPLLNRLAAGEEFEAAVRATTGLSLTEFEDGWRRAVRSRYTIGTWLVAGGMWALLAFGVLVAGVARRRRDRPRRAALDIGWPLPEEELGPPAEPSGGQPPLDPDPRP